MRRALESLLFSAALFAAPAGAVEVSYFPLNLADVVPGEDLWRYQYQLDEFPYDAGFGFTVYFDADLYANLDETPSQPHPDWDAIAVEPDVSLGEPGLYDAEALFDAPSVDVVFTVTFRWLGEGTPGAQPFEVRDPSLEPVETGTTVLPEPAALLASVAATALLASLRRKAA